MLRHQSGALSEAAVCRLSVCLSVPCQDRFFWATRILFSVFLPPPKAREDVFTGVALCVCLSVCLSVTTITKKIVDGFVPNFTERFLVRREDQVRVSLRSVEGCASNGQKARIVS